MQVEGIRADFYLLAADAPLLETAISPDALPPRTELIAPLDSFLWDRAQIEALFDFSYRWEIYTPAAKRQYGYYVLPVLQGERLCGRVECLRDRKQNLLRVPRFWPEKGAKIDRRALRRALKRLASLNGVEKLELRFTN